MVLFFSHMTLQGDGVEKMEAQNNQDTICGVLEGFEILWLSGQKPDMGHALKLSFKQLLCAGYSARV